MTEIQVTVLIVFAIISVVAIGLLAVKAERKRAASERRQVEAITSNYCRSCGFGFGIQLPNHCPSCGARRSIMREVTEG